MMPLMRQPVGFDIFCGGSIQALLQPNPLLGGCQRMIKFMLNGQFVHRELQAVAVPFADITLSLPFVEVRIGQYAQQVVPKRAFASPVLQVQLFHSLLVFAAQVALGFVLIAAQVQLADVAVRMKILNGQGRSGEGQAA